MLKSETDCCALQSMAETMRIVRQAMKANTRQLLKFDSDDFIDDAIYMDQQEQEQQKCQAASASDANYEL